MANYDKFPGKQLYQLLK